VHPDDVGSDVTQAQQEAAKRAERQARLDERSDERHTAWQNDEQRRAVEAERSDKRFAAWEEAQASKADETAYRWSPPTREVPRVDENGESTGFVVNAQPHDRAWKWEYQAARNASPSVDDGLDAFARLSSADQDFIRELRDWNRPEGHEAFAWELAKHTASPSMDPTTRASFRVLLGLDEAAVDGVISPPAPTP
jgi:hypothetical protein